MAFLKFIILDIFCVLNCLFKLDLAIGCSEMKASQSFESIKKIKRSLLAKLWPLKNIISTLRDTGQ